MSYQEMDPGDFPLTVETLRADDESFLWGVTLFAPRPRDPTPVFVPTMCALG